MPYDWRRVSISTKKNVMSWLLMTVVDIISSGGVVQ